LVRKGFKAWCERTAGQYRKPFGIEATAPLCAWNLATHLGVVVKTPQQIPDLSPEVIDFLLGEKDSSWSAATISHNAKEWVILNSSHPPGRQSNDLMHELSHIICGHEPARLDVSDDGLLVLLSYNADQEEEADLLGATLLLPREALLHIAKLKLGLDEVKNDYNVSKDLFNMRMARTGVNKQLTYRRKPLA
jgi:Zn-dependent peptidase ImmA (M78 family)